MRLPSALRGHPITTLFALFTLLFTGYQLRQLLTSTYHLLSLPIIWPRNSESFLISEERDSFDITFERYNRTQVSAAEDGFEDKVPAILHHIQLGGGGGGSRHGHGEHGDPGHGHGRHRSGEHHSSETGAEAQGGTRPGWNDARQHCLDLHPGWEYKLWTDETAAQFVREKYPHLEAMWQGYGTRIQRIDALRYLVLLEYGGVVLDMDLRCTRSLGPLRRFEFVAPAAHPTGFSIGFMMASKGNAFVGELVRNLEGYNRRWFGLPYPTVMFSTGCHYASTIHALAPLPLRKTLKILAGPATNPSLHSLNGPVSTPLFDHLGSSSWHSYDAALIVGLGRSRHALRRITLFVVGVLIALALVMRRRRRGAVVRGAVGTATKAWLWAGRRRREGVLYSPSISGKGTPVEESLRVLEELDIGLEKVGRGRVSVSVSPVEWAREVQGRLA